MSYTQPTPDELEHLRRLCKEGKAYTVPPNLTHEERRTFMKTCIESSQTFCDWCGKPTTAWREDEDDGTISCRPCLDKGYENSKQTLDN